jgi:hypothetical protein
MAKHKWQKLSDGSINHWGDSGGFHNGPICVECGYSFCEHCQPEEWNSECPGRKGFKFSVNFAPYDIWIGFYWNHKGKTLYFCPVPMIVFKFNFSGLFPYCEEVYKL